MRSTTGWHPSSKQTVDISSPAFRHFYSQPVQSFVLFCFHVSGTLFKLKFARKARKEQASLIRLVGGREKNLINNWNSIGFNFFSFPFLLFSSFLFSISHLSLPSSPSSSPPPSLIPIRIPIPTLIPVPIPISNSVGEREKQQLERCGGNHFYAEFQNLLVSSQSQRWSLKETSLGWLFLSLLPEATSDPWTKKIFSYCRNYCFKDSWNMCVCVCVCV